MERTPQRLGATPTAKPPTNPPGSWCTRGGKSPPGHTTRSILRPSRQGACAASAHTTGGGGVGVLPTATRGGLGNTPVVGGATAHASDKVCFAGNQTEASCGRKRRWPERVFVGHVVAVLKHPPTPWGFRVLSQDGWCGTWCWHLPVSCSMLVVSVCHFWLLVCGWLTHPPRRGLGVSASRRAVVGGWCGRVARRFACLWLASASSWLRVCAGWPALTPVGGCGWCPTAVVAWWWLAGGGAARPHTPTIRFSLRATRCGGGFGSPQAGFDVGFAVVHVVWSRGEDRNVGFGVCAAWPRQRQRCFACNKIGWWLPPRPGVCFR